MGHRNNTMHTLDVALIHHDEKELTITIGPKKGNIKFNLGEMDLPDTTTYKYLGITMNTKGDLTDNIVKLKGKVNKTSYHWQETKISTTRGWL